MPSINFASGTTIPASWLNDVDAAVFESVVELQARAQERISVFQFLSAAQKADVLARTYLLNCSRAVYLAQVEAQTRNAAVYFPAGGYLASISARYNNVALLGDGSAVTRVKLPAVGIPITSIVRTSSNPNTVTLNCSAEHNAWVGKDISVAGCATAHCNVPYIVTAITSPTSLVASNLGFVGGGYPTGTFGAAMLYEANPLTLGGGADGNFATPYSGLTLRGMTFDGNKAARVTPPTDSSDYGVFLTAFSRYDIDDVYAVDCHNVGVGVVINSNYGHIEAFVEGCGAALGYPGFDVNSSKYIDLDIVSKDCAQGARVLDNCYSITGRISVHNATSHGFIYQNQTVNSSYANDLHVTVNACGGNGIILGENITSSNLVFAVRGATGVGVNIVEASAPANRPNGCTITATTENCGLQGLVSYADACSITHVSRNDGRTGAAGSNYATDVYGNESTYSVVIKNTGTPQSRGLVVRANATDNKIVEVTETGLVSTFSDAGTRTRLRGWLQGSVVYNPPSLADGAGATASLAVPGAVLGDLAVASFGQDLQGLLVTAYVSAADTVSVRFQNETGGVLDLSNLTLRARVMKAEL